MRSIGPMGDNQTAVGSRLCWFPAPFLSGGLVSCNPPPPFRIAPVFSYSLISQLVLGVQAGNLWVLIAPLGPAGCGSFTRPGWAVCSSPLGLPPLLPRQVIVTLSITPSFPLLPSFWWPEPCWTRSRGSSGRDPWGEGGRRHSEVPKQAANLVVSHVVAVVCWTWQPGDLCLLSMWLVHYFRQMQA